MISPSLNAKQTASASRSHPLFARENLTPFVLVTALFFLLGIPNNLNDVLIRAFMGSFEINRMTGVSFNRLSIWVISRSRVLRLSSCGGLATKLV